MNTITMTQQPLEKTVEKETEKNGSRKLLADTTALVTYALVVGTANEHFIIGLTPQQILKSRAINVPLNIVLGRPYGSYRDLVFHTCNVTEQSGFFKKFFADVGAMSSFWLPIYAGILYSAGADKDQITTGCASTVVVAAITGRPFGWYLDKLRQWFGVKPEYLDNKVEE